MARAEPIDVETIPDKAPSHYVDNVKFWNDFVQFRIDNAERVARGERPIIPDSIGKPILEICTRLSYRFNFINYHFREEMVGDALINCVNYIWNFDPEKSKNPFSYFTLVAFRTFIRRIQKEKKIMETKMKFIEHMKIDIFNMGDINAVDNDQIQMQREIEAVLGGVADVVDHSGFGDFDE